MKRFLHDYLSSETFLPSLSFLGILFTLFFTLAFITYQPVLENQFVFDDFFQIINNPWITSLSHINDIFSHRVWFFSYSFPDGVNPYYRPVMHLVFAIEYFFFGLHPASWHIVHIVWHAFNSVLLFLFILLFFKILLPKRSLKDTTSSEITRHATLLSALLGSLLFLVHPIHAEIVNWVAAVPELALFSCALLSILFFLLAQKKPSFRLLSAFFFFVATLSKETGYLLLFFLIFLDFFLLPLAEPLKKSIILWLKENWIFFMATAVSLALRSFAPYDQSTNVLIPGPPFLLFNVFFDGPVILLQYLSHFLFPLHLSFLYPFQPMKLERFPWGVLSSILSIVLLLFWKYSFSKKYTLPSLFVWIFSVTWIILFLSPSLLSSLLGMSTLSDRYFYLPSVGLSILVAFLARSFLIREKRPLVRNFFFLFFFLLLFVLATLSYQRSFVWFSGETLFVDSIKRHDQALWPQLLLASYFADLGITTQQDHFETLLKQKELALTDEGVEKIHCSLRQIRYQSLLLGGNVSMALSLMQENENNPLCREGTPNHQSKTFRNKGMASFFLNDTLLSEKYLLQAYTLLPSMETARSLAHYYCFTENKTQSHSYAKEALRLGDHKERVALLVENCETENPQKLYRELESFHFLP